MKKMFKKNYYPKTLVGVFRLTHTPDIDHYSHIMYGCWDVKVAITTVAGLPTHITHKRVRYGGKNDQKQMLERVLV